MQSRLTTAQLKNTEHVSDFQVYVDNGETWPVLSPSELHQIQINPASCNFGSVVVKSLAKRNLTIVNNFTKEILFELEINQEELNETYPASIIVPGTEFDKIEKSEFSSSTMELIIERNSYSLWHHVNRKVNYIEPGNLVNYGRLT